MSLPSLSIGDATNGPFERGRIDCIQDGNENCPFGSVGGLESRADLLRPKYISPDDWPRYREGYEAQARAWYGDEWRTTPFSWQLAGILKAAKGNPEEPLYEAHPVGDEP